MKYSIRVLLAVIILLLPVTATASTWKIDPDHSNIMFQVRHLGLVEVKGIFRKFEGTVNLEDNIAKSSVNVTIDAASVDYRGGKTGRTFKDRGFLRCGQISHHYVCLQKSDAGRARQA